MGKAVEKELRKRMRASPKPKLAFSTIEKKTVMGAPFPTRTWWEWGELIKAPIELHYETKRFARSTITLQFVNKIHKGKNRKRGQIPNGTLAEFLEHGTHTSPARPVFGPLAEEVTAGTVASVKAAQKKMRANLIFSF